MNMLKTTRYLELNPLASSIFSFFTFSWTYGVFKKGKTKTLEITDLYRHLDDHASGYLGEKFTQIWNEDIKTGSPSLISVILKCYKWQFIGYTASTLALECVLKIFQPIFLGYIIGFFISWDASASRQCLYWYSAGLILTSLLQVVFSQTVCMGLSHLILKVRVAVCSLIYRKSLRLSNSAVGKTSVGQTVNLLSNDVLRFDTGLIILSYLMVGPIQTILVGVLMWQEIGPASLIGIAIFLIAIPLQLWLGKKTSGYRLKTASLTDQRVSLMSEIVSGIKIIKMYTWERPFSKLIALIRGKEITELTHSSYIRATVASFEIFNARFAIFCSILLYTALGNEINSRKVFVIISYISLLKQSMAVLFPNAITCAAELLVSVDRLQNFLCLEEVSKTLSSSLQHPQSPRKTHFDLTEKKVFVNVQTEKNNDTDDESMVPFFSTNKNVKEIKLKWSVQDAASDDASERNGSVLGEWENLLEKPVDTTKDIVIEDAVCLDGAYVKWRSYDLDFVLSNITLNIKPGSLVAVIGAVGSGKTSLLYTLLKEIPLVSGTLDVFGDMSYAAQEPWLYGGTIRENILFGSKMDRHRYNTVIRKCNLDQDLSVFPDGDRSIVGDRGTNLSGGQRARVNLARAVYRTADIYLLDDPLSAIDSKVGHQIFDECIKEFLAEKTRILVTHQLQYLDQVDHIIILKDGTVSAQGDYEFMLQCPELTSLLNAEVTEEEAKPAPPPASPLTSARKRLTICSDTSVEEIMEEEQEEEQVSQGSVGGRIYKAYALSAGPGGLLIVFLLAAALTQILASGADYWISYWVASEEKHYNSALINEINNATEYYNLLNSTFDSNNFTTEENQTDKITDEYSSLQTTITSDAIDNLLSENLASNKNSTFSSLMENTTLLNTNTSTLYEEISSIGIDHVYSRTGYVNIYTALIIILVIMSLFRSYYFFWLCMQASARLHRDMFFSIIRGTMRFFSTNTMGRILNRFSKDMGLVDEILPVMILEVIRVVMQLVGVLVLISIVNYWLLLPAVLITIIFGIVRDVYLCTSRGLKRLEGTTRSPVFSHMSSTLQGLTTIRAFRNQRHLEKQFDGHQNMHSSAWFMFVGTARAFGYLMDLICVALVAVVTVSFLFQSEDIVGSNVGLALTQVITLTAALQYGMRQSAEMENYMTSVERILEYTDIEQEPVMLSPIDRHLSKLWPEEGGITFSRVWLRYSPNGVPALSDMTFSVYPHEKIGIVGRTGAGKSSIINALFRLSFMNGDIVIDGVNTEKIGLFTLRSRISIIPQEPVLFSGTIRRNLDPFNEYSDDILWTALEQVEMKSDISDSPKGLNASISEGGSNFSVGQRQLICLARAIIRQNRILVLDEATANVDQKTDALIQKTIKENFADCTVLTIAHRLQTIMNSDRVLVVDAGSVAEFDHPYVLLQNQQSMFHGMVKNTGDFSLRAMTQIAQESYESSELESHHQ